MEISVYNCTTCPFLISYYDDYAVDFDSIDYCGLAKYLKLEDDIIDVYNSYEKQSSCEYCEEYDIDDADFDKNRCRCDDLSNKMLDSKIKPEWCPLNKEEIIIK